MSLPDSNTSAQGAENRLILHFLRLWEEVAGERAMPRLRDFSGDILEPFKPFSVVIDLQDGYDNPVIRHVGSAIANREGADARGLRPDEVPRRTILSRITDHFFEVLANRGPVGFEADFIDDDGKNIPYRGILTPLSDNGEDINFILAAINWKGAPPWNQAGETADLAATLAALRDRIAGAGRGRNELYELLSAIYGFHRRARNAEAEYQALLREHGIRAQLRAPFTAVLKLAFGANYDKTRLTEYAAAMSYADRQDLDRTAFRAALFDTPGGVKGLVRAERSARRNGGGPEDPWEATKTTLSRMPPRAVVEDWRGGDGGDEDYVVLLARRESGSPHDLAVLGALPANSRDLKRFVRETPDG